MKNKNYLKIKKQIFAIINKKLKIAKIIVRINE
jgi:hypothetical protein